MKSPIVEKFAADEKEGYSDLKVLRSNAGWYIGTIFTDKDGSKEPGSRDSQYFKTRDEAVRALDSNEFEQREHP